MQIAIQFYLLVYIYYIQSNSIFFVYNRPTRLVCHVYVVLIVCLSKIALNLCLFCISMEYNCMLSICRIVWRTANKASEGAGSVVDLFVHENVDVIIGSPLSSGT